MDEIERLREELAEANARRADMRTALEWANEERDEAHAREIACATETLAMQRERDSLKAAWEQEKLRSDELREERDNWKQSSDERNDECNRIQRALNMCAEERDLLRERCERLANNHEWRVEELAARNKELAALRKERDEARAEAARRLDELNMVQSQATRARASLEEAYAELDALEATILEHLPYSYDDGSDDGASPDECVEFASKELAELRAEVERLHDVDHAAKFESGLGVLRREADEACKMVTRIEQEAYRIKLEARAEVATAAKYCDELAETIRMHVAREIELEAEVERLRVDMATSNESFTAGYKDGARDAYRRGAEAMREACAKCIEGDGNGRYGLTGEGAAKTIRALAIPEDKP